MQPDRENLSPSNDRYQIVRIIAEETSKTMFWTVSDSWSGRDIANSFVKSDAVRVVIALNLLSRTLGEIHPCR